MFTAASDKPHGARRLDQVIWDPTDSERFIVGGGTDVKMYEWTERGNIQLVTVQTDLQHMKSLAWAPSTAFRDLIAVGMSSGTVELMRLQGTKTSPSDRRNHFDSPKTAVLIPRHSRPCLTLAFSPVDPNYLAAGLDRVRNECSLLIWDIEHSLRLLGSEEKSPSASLYSTRPQPPLPPRGISSLRGNTIPLQIYAASEAVHSVAFVPSTHGLVVGGMSQKYVRLYDLRDSGPANGLVQTWNTKCVYGLCFDPFDDNRFAGFGDDHSIRVWDRRNPGEPVMHLVDGNTKDGGRSNAIASIAWSPTHRGLLVSLAQESETLRMWNMATNERLLQEPDIRSDDGKSESAASLTMYSTSTRTVDTNVSPGPLLNLPVLAGTRKSASLGHPIISFAFVPHGLLRDSTPHVVALGRERNLVIRALSAFVQHVWSARGHVAMACGTNVRVVSKPFASMVQDFQAARLLPDGMTIASKTPRPTNGEQKDGHSRRSRPLVSTSKSQLHSSLLVPRGDSPSSLRRLPMRRGSASPARDTDGTATPRPRFRTLPSSSSLATDGVERTIPVIRPPSDKQSDGQDRGKKKSRRRMIEVSRVLGGDISLLMVHRAQQGYGLFNHGDNARIVSDEPYGTTELPALWTWLNDHERSLSGESSGESLHVLGFDFSIQGVMGLWNGFPSDQKLDNDAHRLRRDQQAPGRRNDSPLESWHGNYDEAIAQLSSTPNHKQMSYMVSSKYPERRRLALALCGWDLSDEELFHWMMEWEKEGQHAKAACWSLFTHNVDRAVDILMRSGDERARAFSAAVAGFEDPRASGEDVSKDNRTQRWRDQCEKLIVRTDDPYLRTVLQYMVTDGWLDVLDEQSLPLKDRLGLAFRFLRDDQMSPWLQRLCKEKVRTGQIDGLVITGLTAPGLDLLQTHVDRYGDVQTAAILGTLASPSMRSDYRIARWVESYHDLLDRWKLFHQRCQFDIDRGRLIRQAIEDNQLEPYEWVERQVVVRCNLCNKVISASNPASLPGKLASERALMTHCPSCRSTLPACSICLMPVGMPSDFLRDAALRQDTQVHDTLDSAMVFCMTCRHGGHSAHILDWFHGTPRADGEPHKVCPVADCTCRCADQRLE